MKKRNYIEEIISIKNRTDFSGSYNLITRLHAIDSLIYNMSNKKKDYKSENEVLKYVTIATVACFESYFKSIVSELVDKGEPYSKNVLQFNHSKNIKFDFNIVNAIQKNKISMGNFVSHILSCNNINDFISHLSTLTNSNFINELKIFESTNFKSDIINASGNFKKNYNKILKSIDKIFEFRHIFCHEYATNIELELELIEDIYEDSKIFLLHTNDYILSIIYPDRNLSLDEKMNKTEKELEIEESKLHEVINEIKKVKDRYGFKIEDLENVVNKWRDYREVKANFFLSLFKDFSSNPLPKVNSKLKLTKQLIDEFIEEWDLKL